MNDVDFDADEAIFFLATAAIAGVLAFQYYRVLVSISSFGRSIRRLVIALIPAAAILPTFVVLSNWADVRAEHFDYALLFLAGAAAWVFAASYLVAFLGISTRDDAIERNNPAALTAVGGFMMSVGIVYAFSNIGEGPTIWTTILLAVAATILLILMWLLIESIGGGVADAVTIDRDSAAAQRLAGAAIGCAIILGRAAAGKWISWHQSWVDLFLYGWPVVILAVTAGVLHRIMRPNAQRPKPDRLRFGIIPAIAFILAGIIIVAMENNGLSPSEW